MRAYLLHLPVHRLALLCLVASRRVTNTGITNTGIVQLQGLDTVSAAGILPVKAMRIAARLRNATNLPASMRDCVEVEEESLAGEATVRSRFDTTSYLERYHDPPKYWSRWSAFLFFEQTQHATDFLLIRTCSPYTAAACLVFPRVRS